MPSDGPRRLVVGGVTSGVGKTTVVSAMLAAWRRRGRSLQPFKAGPDYIDPTYHTLAADRACRNLDSVLLPPATMRALADRAAAGVDLALVEGVMGLFDGRNAAGEEGSTAQIAKLLGAPIVVVIDVAKTARTAGAIALGCARFDPGLTVAGFILNRVGSEAHARTATQAIEAATGLPVLGAIPRDDALTLPERHLGLVPTAENAPTAAYFDRLADLAERHLALDRLWSIAATPPAPGSGLSDDLADLFPAEPPPTWARIAVARDRAFNFYYEDSLDVLAAWGAELVPFSPLADRALPDGTQGVYLGGGFPELFAAELAANRPMHGALRRAAAAGLPVYGECGGLMYLGESLRDFAGRCHPMAGVVPVASAMQRQRVTVGYRTATALRRTPLLEPGMRVVGHEFHYSQLESPVAESNAAYRLVERDGLIEGFAAGNVLASYLHVHFGSDPAMARRLVAASAAATPLAP
jgi:cobyrinic acid a,c-diamide synthase